MYANFRVMPCKFSEHSLTTRSVHFPESDADVGPCGMSRSDKTNLEFAERKPKTPHIFTCLRFLRSRAHQLRKCTTSSATSDRVVVEIRLHETAKPACAVRRDCHARASHGAGTWWWPVHYTQGFGRYRHADITHQTGQRCTRHRPRRRRARAFVTNPRLLRSLSETAKSAKMPRHNPHDVAKPSEERQQSARANEDLRMLVRRSKELCIDPNSRGEGPKVVIGIHRLLRPHQGVKMWHDISHRLCSAVKVMCLNPPVQTHGSLRLIAKLQRCRRNARKRHLRLVANWMAKDGHRRQA